MSAQGFLNIQLVLQRLFVPPVSIDSVTFQAFLHPSYQKRLSLPKLGWYFTRVTQVLVPGLCFPHIYWLISTWPTHRDFEQFGFYMLTWAIYLIGGATYTTIGQHKEEFCEVFTLIAQRFKFGGDGPQSDRLPTFKRGPGFRELCVYGFGCSFFGPPILLFAAPLVRSYDLPILLQWVGHALHIDSNCVILNYFVKVVISVILGISGVHGTAFVLWLFCFALMFVKVVQNLSFKLYPESVTRNGNTVGRFKINLEMNSMWINVRSNRTTQSLTFWKYLNLFRQVELLIRLGNLLVADYLCALTGLGIFVGTWGGYILIMAYSELPFVLYICWSTFFPIFLFICFQLVPAAAIPQHNGRLFRQYWKYEVKLKIDRLRLIACPPIGYSYGPIKLVRRQTALDISNLVFNLISTLALMRMKE